MDLKKNFGTDKTKEVEGVWFDFGDGCRVKIARFGNPKYKEVYNELIKPHIPAVRRKSVSGEILEEILNTAIAKTILVNWEGIEEDGTDIPYTWKEAERILKKYTDFREQIVSIAQDMDNFKISVDEDSEKN